MRNKTPQKKTFIFVCHHRFKNMCENARVFTGFRSTKKKQKFPYKLSARKSVSLCGSIANVLESQGLAGWENTQKVSQTNMTNVARSQARHSHVPIVFVSNADWVQPEFIDFLGKARHFWRQFGSGLVFPDRLSVFFSSSEIGVTLTLKTSSVGRLCEP